MSEDGRTQWVSTEVDEDTHRTLLFLATETGQHPTRLINQFICDGLVRAAKEAQDPSPITRTYQAIKDLQGRQRTKSQLEKLGWAALKDANETEFEKFVELCQVNDFEPDSILSEVKDRETAPIVIEDDGTGITSAMRWLEGQLEGGQEQTVNMIKIAASAMGFTLPTLNRAKQNLGVRSVRKSKHWTWVLDEPKGKRASPNTGRRSKKEPEPF